MGPTHKENHTLDLILTRSGDKLLSSTPSIVNPHLSDHYAVNCKLLLEKPMFPRKQITYRKIKNVDLHRFCDDVTSSGLLTRSQPSSTMECLIADFENVLSTILDVHAPEKTRLITVRPSAPWLTQDVYEQKIERRRLERKWRSTGLTVHREMYSQKCLEVNKLIAHFKSTYYAGLIDSCGSNQRELFKVVEKLNKGDAEKQYPSSNSPEALANQFADFFCNKIEAIRGELLCKKKNSLLTLCRILVCRNVKLHLSALNLLHVNSWLPW